MEKYVTKALDRKVGQATRRDSPAWEVGERVEEAKREVESLRERLLDNPTVKEANSQGKVVSPKGLSKLHRTERQLHAITGPKGVTRSKKYGLVARSVLVGPKGAEQLRTRSGFEGSISRLLNEGEALQREREAPSTIEALSIASLGIPGGGIGSGVAKLAQIGASLAARGGAKAVAKQGAARVGQSARSIPTKAGQGARAIPGVAKASPQLAKAGIKATPKALKAGAKGTPRALGRGAVKGGKNVYRAGTGTALVAGTQNAGLSTEPGKVADAILKGTSAAVLNPDNTLETAATTARAIPAAITAPAALLYSAGRIPFDGTEPLESTVSADWEGLFGSDDPKQPGNQAGLVRNLLSGDPHKAQEAVQGQGALAFLTPVPAITRSAPYKAIRSDVRAAAAGARRKAGKGRVAPKGVEQSIFGFTDRKAARQRVAKAHARTTNPFRISEARHQRDVLHGTARKPALEKVPPEWGHTISTLLDAGIRSPEGVKLMRKRGPKSEPSQEGKVNLDAALRIAEVNPQMFKSKPFLRALRAAEKASKTTPIGMAGMGEVARYRTQGNLLGILPPDRAVPPKAREFTSAKNREGAWKDLERMEKRAEQLRAKSRGKAKGRNAPRRKAEIKALEQRARGLRKALDPFTRPGQKTAAGERMFWDKQMEKEYVSAVKARRKGSPLVEPAWTHHATFSSAKAGMEPGALPGKAGGKVYVNRGRLAESDLVDRSLEAFVRGTIQMPRRRGGGAEFAREFTRQETIPFTLGGKEIEIVPDSETWAKITSPKSESNPDGGQFDPKTYARMPIRELNTALRDPTTTEGDFAKLLKDAEEGRVPGHEPSVVVLRESIREFRAIANPQHSIVTEGANKLARVSNRLILGTNPTWLMAQIPAEGIPLALAKPSLLNPVKTGSILKDIQAFRKEHPEQAAVIEGAAGASPEITAGSLRSPMDLEKGGSFNPEPKMFANAAKELTKGKWGRAMRSAAKLEPLGLFDVKRQNAYRSTLLAAEADKRFRSWTGGVQGLFRTSSRLSRKFKGKSREELWTWLSTTKEGKRELAKLAEYVDNVQGNWTAFTRYEKAFAPLLIFYPFLRYSLRWTLWTFPRNHPVVATIAFTLGQVNSNELEKLFGAKPASPRDWALPVVRDAEGKADTLPGGLRISPGQSVLQQAITGGNPSQLAGAFNPILGAGLTAIGGPTPFGTKPTNAKGWAAVDQLLAMPAPLRHLDIKSEKIAATLGLTRPPVPSVIEEAFDKLDKNRGLRQAIAPWLPQSGKDARRTNELARALRESQQNSKSAQSDVASDESLRVQTRQKKIREMEKGASRARNTIDRILKELGLNEASKESYERWKESMFPSEDSGGFGLGSFGEFGDSTEFGFGGGNQKALKYKPPKAGGIDIPGLPDIGGVIPNFLGALVLGEKAQAATGKGRKKTTLTGPLTAGQKTFAKTLAKESGLSPRVVGAWALAEQSSDAAKQREAEGNHNWLNIAYYDSGAGEITQDPVWSNPKSAAKATARFLKGQQFGASEGIQAIPPRSRGKGPQAQIQAIGESGWATNPAYTESIKGTLSLVGVKNRKPVPKKVMTRFKAAVTAAKQLEKADLPYVWGGGHGDPESRPTGGGLDCSGAVSYVLNKMGALKGSLVSGEMGSVLKPGPGAVTVFYNPTHTFMRIGNRYFGTSRTNEGGGAGFIEGKPDDLSKYSVGHVPGLGKKVAASLGVPTSGSAPSSFPGISLSDSGTTATVAPSSAKETELPGFSKRPIRPSPLERLKTVNAILEGDLSEMGVSTGGSPLMPSVADLAELGRSLETERRKLLRL